MSFVLVLQKQKIPGFLDIVGRLRIVRYVLTILDGSFVALQTEALMIVIKTDLVRFGGLATLQQVNMFSQEELHSIRNP